MNDYYYIKYQRNYLTLNVFICYSLVVYVFINIIEDRISLIPIILFPNFISLLFVRLKTTLTDLNQYLSLVYLIVVAVGTCSFITGLNSILIKISPFSFEFNRTNLTYDEFHILTRVLFISNSFFFIPEIIKKVIIGNAKIDKPKFMNEVQELKNLKSQNLISTSEYEINIERKTKDYCSSRIILSDGYKRLFLSYKKNVISENEFNMAKQRLFNTELTKINTNY